MEAKILARCRNVAIIHSLAFATISPQQHRILEIHVGLLLPVQLQVLVRSLVACFSNSARAGSPVVRIFTATMECGHLGGSQIYPSPTCEITGSTIQ